MQKQFVQNPALRSGASVISPVLQHLAVDDVLRSPGESLDPTIRASMESRFGHDFSQVRVHTDESAVESARALNAQAYTVRNHIVFDSGRYAPQVRGGRELLAHELTHVVQQAGQSAQHSDLALGAVDDAFEREADRVAHSTQSGQQARVSARMPAPAIQRQQGQAPTVQTHPRDVTSNPTSGTISAGGQFTVAYTFTNTSGPGFAALTLGIPEGVAVGITPISYIDDKDYRITNPGGTGARAITIAASVDLTAAPRFQVTFTKGSFSYIVIFVFPSSPPPSPGPSPSPSPTP